MARKKVVAEGTSGQRRLRVFIGSSVEGLAIAQQLQVGLEYAAETTIWHQGVFGLSKGTLENLLEATDHVDFAILALTPDDLTTKRGQRKNSPRDNVVFELGLFMGALGRERAFIVYCRDEEIDLPSDLAGVTPVTFAKRSDGNLEAALGPVCTRLQKSLALGAREVKTGVHVIPPTARDPLFEEILKSSLHVVCRAASLPVTPSEAKLRVFVFRYQRRQLVCTHFYDADPAEEVVGETRFDVTPATAKKIVVVEAFLKKKVVRRTLDTTGEGTPGVHGRISRDLKAVLAAPIKKDGKVWGVVDFDTGTKAGSRLLESKEADSAIHAIASHLALLVQATSDSEQAN